ncbi:hypothetical protein B0H13DRAFT_2345065 [Mycena leptocephala]|nr:hypothetical protein B0H13DRAFT_2345065 [Mycena leptocephala]
MRRGHITGEACFHSILALSLSAFRTSAQPAHDPADDALPLTPPARPLRGSHLRKATYIPTSFPVALPASAMRCTRSRAWWAGRGVANGGSGSDASQRRPPANGSAIHITPILDIDQPGALAVNRPPAAHPRRPHPIRPHRATRETSVLVPRAGPAASRLWPVRSMHPYPTSLVQPFVPPMPMPIEGSGHHFFLVPRAEVVDARRRVPHPRRMVRMGPLSKLIPPLPFSSSAAPTPVSRPPAPPPPVKVYVAELEVESEGELVNPSHVGVPPAQPRQVPDGQVDICTSACVFEAGCEVEVEWELHPQQPDRLRTSIRRRVSSRLVLLPPPPPPLLSFRVLLDSALRVDVELFVVVDEDKWRLEVEEASALAVFTPWLKLPLTVDASDRSDVLPARCANHPLSLSAEAARRAREPQRIAPTPWPCDEEEWDEDGGVDAEKCRSERVCGRAVPPPSGSASAIRAAGGAPRPRAPRIRGKEGEETYGQAIQTRLERVKIKKEAYFNQILFALLPGVHPETIAARSRNTAGLTPTFNPTKRLSEDGLRFYSTSFYHFTPQAAICLTGFQSDDIKDGDVVVFNQLLPLDVTIRLRRAMVPEPELIAKCKQIEPMLDGHALSEAATIAKYLKKIAEAMPSVPGSQGSKLCPRIGRFVQLPRLQRLSGELQAVSHDQMTKTMAFCAEISEVEAMPVYLEVTQRSFVYDLLTDRFIVRRDFNVLQLNVLRQRSSSCIASRSIPGIRRDHAVSRAEFSEAKTMLVSLEFDVLQLNSLHVVLQHQIFMRQNHAILC